MYHPFSVRETFSTAWRVLRRNFATIAVYSLLAIVIIAGSFFMLDFIFADVILTSVGVFVLLIGISFIFLGFIKLIFQLIDREYYDFEFKDIVPGLKMLFSYLLLLVIVSSLAVFMARGIQTLDEKGFLTLTDYEYEGEKYNLLALFVGLFFQFFFLFYFPICACFIVDDSSGPFESVVQSWQLIKGNFLKYFLLFLMIEVMVFVGSVLVIGIIFVIPFVNILLVVAYRKLVYSHLDVDDDITETV